MANVGKWILGGSIGGLVGAFIWAGIIYATKTEIGWIAWGVGFLVGLGVRIAAGDDDGVNPGMTAVIIAILSLVIGKFFAVYFLVADATAKFKIDISPEAMVSQLAHEIAKDRVTKGKRVNWPPGKTPDMAYNREDFPADIWQEASAKWAKVPPAEQQQKRAAQEQQMQAALKEIKSELRSEAIKQSFGPWDLLWFLLATITAFKLGSGAAGQD